MDQTHTPGATDHSPPDPEAATLHWEKQPSKGPPTWLVVVLGVGVIALAADVFVVWREREALAEELKELRTERAELVAAKRASEEKLGAERLRTTELENGLTEARTALDSTRQELDVLEQEVADTDAQMRELEKMAARFQRMIDSGKLQISLRRGRMVVDLPARVLFPSGSAELSEEGKQAIREVSRVLRSVRGKRFIVGGHTDNKKLTKKAPFSSNWALSAARAVVVTEAMVDAGLRPNQLVAAGYGPHDPVARNRSQRGRQQNRRIEIILEPQVRSLPKEKP